MEKTIGADGKARKKPTKKATTIGKTDCDLCDGTGIVKSTELLMPCGSPVRDRDGAPRKVGGFPCPECRPTAARRAGIVSYEPQPAGDAAAPASNPLITAWDKATRAQRHEFIRGRKLEVMRAQQQIGPAAHEVEPPTSVITDPLDDIPGFLDRTKGGAP